MDVAILADDLSGANVDGALLAEKGFTNAACVNLSLWDPAVFADYETIAINTDSRLMSEKEARECVYQAMRLILPHTPQLLAKRIDSGLRGNVGGEIEALLQAIDDLSESSDPNNADFQLATAIVVPAFPSSRRIAVGDYLLVDGTPLERSPLTKTSSMFLRSTRISYIIAQQTEFKIGLVSLEIVLRGVFSIRAEINALRQNGCRIIICDSATNDDINAIADALGDATFPILATDPGPFTAALASVRVVGPRAEQDNRVLMIVGNAGDLTRRQIDALCLSHSCHVVRVNCWNLVNEKERPQEIVSIIHKIASYPENARVLAVYVEAWNNDMYSVGKDRSAIPLTSDEIQSIVNTCLSEITTTLLNHAELKIAGLYVSDGRTVTAVVHALNARGLVNYSEIQPMTVYGHLIEGQHPDFPIITKGGFVGNVDSLTRSIDYLFAKLSTKKRTSLGV